MNDKIRGMIVYEGQYYVNRGGSTGYFYAAPVVPADSWDGPKLTYNELSPHNGSGGNFHGNYQIVHWKGDDYVTLPYQITRFFKIDEPVYKQQTLF